MLANEGQIHFKDFSGRKVSAMKSFYKYFSFSGVVQSLLSYFSNAL